MKHLLLTTIAAVVLVGCGSESPADSMAYYIADQTGFGVLHGTAQTLLEVRMKYLPFVIIALLACVSCTAIEHRDKQAIRHTTSAIQ
jgi:uncharacterized protein YcfL